MKRNIILFLFIWVYNFYGQNTSPVVSNVDFTYNGSQVTVTYDVNDSEQNTVTIDMKVSTDGGASWDYNYGTATGDIGENIPKGTNKSITFAFSDNNANLKIRIIAYDETAGGTGCGNVVYDGGPNDDGNGNYYYTTIVIGHKCWIRENINAGTQVDPNAQEDGSTTKRKYCYDNNSNNCNTFGGLYIYDMAKIICPEGWRLPSKADYEDMLSYIRDGNELKMNGHYSGTDLSGFNGLLGGIHSHNTVNNYNEYAGVNSIGYYWTSTLDADGDANNGDGTVFKLHTGSDYDFDDHFAETHAASVRCVKDMP